MMKKIQLFFCLAISLLLFSCNDDVYDLGSSPEAESSAVINKSAKLDGVKYSLNNITVNPNLVILNSTDVIVKSTEGELQNGIYNLEVLLDELASKLVTGNILYFQNENNSYLKVITGVNLLSDNNYSVLTNDAYLGDLFESGSLELSIDVQETEKVLKTRKSSLLKSNYEQGLTFDIFNYIEEHQYDALTVNPNSTVKAYFNIKIGFAKKSKIFPNEIVATYEVHSAINPYLAFAKPINKEYSFDLIDNVPESIINAIKDIELTIDIPLGELGTLPALVSLEQIKFPGNVTVNASKETNLQYNANGIFKVGYAFYNNVPNMKSHFIYENTMTSTGIANTDLNGEVLSNMEIILIPKISLVNAGLISVTGEVAFGLSTVSNGGYDSETNVFVGGSKGTFNSSGKFSASTLGIPLFTTELFKETKELWNVGTLNNKVAFSNLRIAKPSKSYCALRSYNYEMTLDYKYPILGKKISGDLEISYDVYDDTRKLLKGGEKVVIAANNLTETSFTFNLCVPFKVDAFGFTSGFTKKMAYIKNIVIKDNLGNVCVGIINPATNVVYPEIALGSPYNTSFWK